MKKLIVSFFTIALLSGAAGAFAAGSGLEGEYVESGVENSFLTITADHWTIGGTMKMDYTYTAKKTGENTYELELKTANRYMKGMDMKAVVRKEGNVLFVNNNGTGETKYEKKK
jgi:alkaline phosphatase